jgi:exopolyphosphatase/guanosine-5'-triphosphate,3'-diphosphate pyrophosphatase
VAGPADDDGASAPPSVPKAPPPAVAATVAPPDANLFASPPLSPPSDNSPHARQDGRFFRHRPYGFDSRYAGDRGDVYGALDLGTNNCRLLLARPSRRGFRVVDAFSRIIRLGEGVSQTGRLSQPAMDRTVDALRVCASKLARNGVTRSRCVATEACRIAENGPQFLNRVRDETGLRLEILDRETEAALAVSGCASLIDYRADYVLVFDIGGGSSELVWLDLAKSRQGNRGDFIERFALQSSIAAWTSLPVGVVTLAERFGGHHVTPESFEAMVQFVTTLVLPFEEQHDFRGRTAGAALHLLGTSGTVTTVAGIKLGLERYDRTRVDGCWLEVDEVRGVTGDLLSRTYEQRVAEPCIGHERADLVLAGCAILEALLRLWPAERLRVADRGLREGILTMLMSEDGVFRAGRRRRRRNGQR